jgi:membrane fusion protein (multidrug efflux system)
MVVGQDGKIAPRPLVTSRTVGTDWLVTGGLKPGDKVVMEGAGNLQPGTAVKTTPYSDKTPAAPSGQPGAPAQAK